MLFKNGTGFAQSIFNDFSKFHYFSSSKPKYKQIFQEETKMFMPNVLFFLILKWNIYKWDRSHLNQTYLLYNRFYNHVKDSKLLILELVS